MSRNWTLGPVDGLIKITLQAMAREAWSSHRINATLAFPVAISQKAVMPDALKAVGQNVQQEAANELVGIERHAL